MYQPRNKRRAVTLIELLTVVLILAILFGLGVLFFPDIEQQSRTANGAIALQGWLEIAKQRAQRDQIAHGLRLFDNGNGNKHVTECQYIEQPDPFAEGTLTVAAQSNQVTVNANLQGGTGLPRVRAGDYLEVLDSGLVHRITAVQEPNPGQPPFTLTLASQIFFSINNSANYRILRQPRLVGEESLKLPSGIIVDMATNGQFGNNLAFNGNNADILFSPSGEVIGTQTLSDQVYFWVRDSSLALVDGQPSIIAVRTKSGHIAAYEVDVTDGDNNQVPDDPYRFADGR